MCGGTALEDGAYGKGHFIAPTIFADVTPRMRIAQEEIFGPVVSVIPCSSFEEAMEIGNGVRYGLSSSIYTQDINRAFVAMREMNTGIFYVNSPTIGAEIHLPFGGTKDTGNGHREAAEATLEVFSEWKSSTSTTADGCSGRRSTDRPSCERCMAADAGSRALYASAFRSAQALAKANRFHQHACNRTPARNHVSARALDRLARANRQSWSSILQGSVTVNIGLPKEVKDNEYRVGMVPAGVHALVEEGHKVWVQRRSGRGIRIPGFGVQRGRRNNR